VTVGAEVSRIQLHGWSGSQARDCAKGLEKVQATTPGDHAPCQGRQHGDDDGRLGPVYAMLAELFRILRNAGGADWFNPLGSIATPGSNMAAVENITPSPSSPDGTRGPSATGEQYCRKWTWPFGTSRGPKLSRWSFLMPTSNRWGFPHCSRRVDTTDSNRRVRTRMHGGVGGVGG
jgi:hypothetical protein